MSYGSEYTLKHLDADRQSIRQDGSITFDTHQYFFLHRQDGPIRRDSQASLNLNFSSERHPPFHVN